MDGAKRTLAIGYYPRVSAVLPEKSKFHKKKKLFTKFGHVCSFVLFYTCTAFCLCCSQSTCWAETFSTFFIYRWLKSQHSVLFRGFFFLGGGGFIEFMLQWMASQKTKNKKRERKKKNDRHLTSITGRRTENEDNIFIVEKCCRKVEEAAAERLR